MGDILSFPTKPEDWPWSVIRQVIEDQVKRSAPEIAPEAVAARMKPDVLRWIDRAGEISSGVGPLERERLVTFLSEVIADRLLSEVERERERA
jgi:hypothetical protein